jgi:hypothetical protein
MYSRHLNSEIQNHTLDTGHRKTIARQFAVLNRNFCKCRNLCNPAVSVVQQVKTENKAVLVHRRKHMLKCSFTSIGHATQY